MSNVEYEANTHLNHKFRVGASNEQVGEGAFAMSRGRSAAIAEECDFGNFHTGNLSSEFVADRRAKSGQNGRIMTNDRQEIIKRWLVGLLEEKEETQAKLAKLLGLSTSQMNKTVSGARNLKADELLILAAYYDQELPALPGHGKARIAERSNDNDVGGEAGAGAEDDELWAFAERKVKDEERKRGVQFTNEDFIDLVIKYYDTLCRRSL